MAVLFSQVTVSADNGPKETFLCSGIPKREANLKNWVKYQNFMKDNPDTETVEVNVKSFVYGDGEITDANEYEAAYFTKRGEDFLERSTVKPYGESKFIILTGNGGEKSMVSDVGKEVLRDIGLLAEYIIRKSKGYDDTADNCIKDKIIRDMAEMTSRMKNEIRLVCIDDLRILNDNHDIAVVECVDMLDDAVKKEPYSSKYALTGLVICGDCGSQYRRTTWTANGKRIVWRCVNRLTNGKDACGTSPTIDEERLHTGIVKAMNSMIDGKEKIQSLLNGSIAEILAAPDSHKEIISLKKEIDDKNEDILQMVADGVKNRESRADITAKCRDEYEKIKALQEKLNIAEINSQMEKESGGRLREIYDTISAMPGKMTEYDDNMTRIAVTEVKILSEEKISVTLFGTVTVEVEI